MGSISKSWSDAGSRPGQRQKITITYESRDAGNVKVSYKFSAHSNGTDNYDFNTRHNRFTIYCPKDDSQVSKSYQAQGYCASRSFSGTFTVTGVGDATTELDFYYRNKRVWVKHTDAYEPRSTGVVSKTKIGSLSIPENTKYNIKFVDTRDGGKTYTYTCYRKRDFTVPKISLSSDYYTFQGWAATKGSTTVAYTAGGVIKDVTQSLTYYSIWKPRTCNYNFYDKNKKLITTLKHTVGKPTQVVNLNTYKDGKYKIRGYNFTGWTSNGYTYGPTSTSSIWIGTGSDVNFYPTYEAQTNKLIFVYSPQAIFKYKTDATFRMGKALIELDKTRFTIKPGYKLVGWSTKPPADLAKTVAGFSSTGVALPGQGYKISGLTKVTTIEDNTYYSGSGFRIYPVEGPVKFDYSDFTTLNPKDASFDGNQLKLYPYYEYYATSYVYIDGEWKLAMPYIYTDDGWKMALSYVYTESGWKL